MLSLKIKCALKDSSCDSPISKNLMLTILASNENSSSKKLTQDQKGLFKACNGAECKVPGVNSGGITVPDPLRTVVDISVGNVWITDWTTVSTRSGKSLNMLRSWLSHISSLCATISSSSVFASDTSSAIVSLCTSLVVTRISGASKSHAFPINELKSICYFSFQNHYLRGFPLSFLTSCDSHSQRINRSLKEGECSKYATLDHPWNGYLKLCSSFILTDWEKEEAPGACEEEEGADVPKGPEAGVGKDASAGNKSTSTSEEIYVETALLPSASSRINSVSIRQMSVEDKEVTSISLAVSRGNPALRHNSVIRIGNGK
ncbi:hypothetical protein H5410_013536 [Solanum commersonii]|uniref:Uncharacterized protein n=1 Tax=Solanum commersonii TaxID=4109 RepID=A0A9J5ZNI2_SOLCO|nr:hypothetical protein H5410_013536 [Solanum commersonii]